MNKYIKIGLYGFMVWLVPFAVSFLFYSKNGEVLIDVFLFKSIMLIVSSLTAAILLVIYFKPLKKDQLNDGIVIGISWLAINWLLDLVILVPMSGSPILAYFEQIGLRYLLAPIMSISMGYIAQK